MVSKKLKRTMKKTMAAICAAAISLSVAGTLPAQASQSIVEQNLYQAVIYTQENRTGHNHVAQPNTTVPLGSGYYESVSSLIVGKYMVVKLTDAEGHSLMLAEGVYDNLRHWNNRAAYIETMAVSTGMPRQPLVPEDQCRIFPEHSLYAGSDGKQYFSLRQGEQKLADISQVNKISSVSVGASSRAILEGTDGKNLELWKGNFFNLKEHDNKANSIIITPLDSAAGEVIDKTVGTDFASDKVTFFSDSNAIGDRITLGAGEFDASAFGTIGTKNISSMHVPYGYIVTIYHVKKDPLKSYDPVMYRTYTDGTYNNLGEFDDMVTAVTISRPSGVDYTLNKHRIQYIQNWEKTRSLDFDGQKVMGDMDRTSNVSVTLSNEYATAKTQNRTTSNTVFAGSSVLTNNSGNDQFLTSQQFDFSEENSVTTSITHEVGSSVEGSVEFGIGDISLGTTITASYNYANSNENSTTKSVTYTVPSQNILVPAGKSVKVVARLEKIKATGTVDLYATATVQDSGYLRACRFKGESLGWSNLGTAPYTLNYTAPVKGEGSYEAEYAANLYIDVIDISTNQPLKSAQSEVTVIEDRSGNSVRVVAESMTFDLTQ
ncbi:MAG: ETX/MTX2 family pore-forming toxin [Lachnospiraceae bacterium]|nr:ETX/MTX2 family pore-forming toxin [Lachnospiraceae bacterium]